MIAPSPDATVIRGQEQGGNGLRTSVTVVKYTSMGVAELMVSMVTLLAINVIIILPLITMLLWVYRQL